MLRRTGGQYKYIKGWGLGGKHQKMQQLLPVPFLYRFPDNAMRPGPVLARHLHTLGCFPTGIEVPLRLQELHETYIREHVPLEVEEWLRCFVRRPAELIATDVAAALAAMDTLGRAPKTLHRRALPSATVLTAVEPVQLALAAGGIDVPAFAVRAAVQRPGLRARLADALSEWNDEVQQGGSTPHRRLAARQALIDAGLSVAEEDDERRALLSLAQEARIPGAGEPPQEEREAEAEAAETPAAVAATPEALASSSMTAQGVAAVRSVLNVPDETAPDERLLLEAVTVIAEAAQREARYDLAERLLRDGLRHAHDDETEGRTRANYAAALVGCGRFAEAEAEAREAVLLARQPTAYASWGVAVAYQDDFERAMEIIEDGLAAYPGDPTLAATADKLARAMIGREAVPEHARGKRMHVQQQQRDALRTLTNRRQPALESVGGRLVHRRMSSSTHDGGHQSRRLPGRYAGFKLTSHVHGSQ